MDKLTRLQKALATSNNIDDIRVLAVEVIAECDKWNGEAAHNDEVEAILKEIEGEE